MAVQPNASKNPPKKRKCYADAEAAVRAVNLHIGQNLDEAASVPPCVSARNTHTHTHTFPEQYVCLIKAHKNTRHYDDGELLKPRTAKQVFTSHGYPISLLFHLTEQVNRDSRNVHEHTRKGQTEKTKRSELREMKGRSSFKVKNRGGVTKTHGEEGRGLVHTHQKGQQVQDGDLLAGPNIAHNKIIRLDNLSTHLRSR